MSKLVPFGTRIPSEVLAWIEEEAVTSHRTQSAIGKELLERAYAERASNHGNLTQRAREERECKEVTE
jgi:hypothetical protein